ncbi:MAG: ABC transporter ATP-binding protein [Betaproteobacteria bacterium]
MSERPLLQVRGLSVHFPLARRRPLQPKRVLKAVDGIDLDIARGKTLGLVGESGSGKTTTALAVMQLLAVTGGSIKLEGNELVGFAGGALRTARRDVQMIFQDPYSSLNPRLRAGAIVEEPLRLSAMGDDKQRGERVRELFAQVGLSDGQRALFPHQFSGGQRQRIGIARALALQPKLVVCDEPVSALDVAVQAQVLNLLVRLQEKFGLTYLFISHDLAVVEYMCDEVAVMYLGQIVEYASRERLFERPLHPYTWALFSAIPRIEVGDRSKTNRVRLQGDPPSPIDLPAGCRFAGRCPFAEQVCRDTPPPLREIEAGHRVACHLVGADGSTPHVSARPPASPLS